MGQTTYRGTTTVSANKEGMAYAQVTKVDRCWIDGDPVDCINFEVETHYEQIPITHDMQPDPEWSYHDSAGHYHAYAKNHATPTLTKAIVRTWYCGDCGYEHEDTEIQCVECKEPVKPGTRDGGRTSISIPKATTYRLEVYGGSPIAGVSSSIRLRVGNQEWFGFMNCSQVRRGPDNEEPKAKYEGVLFQREITLEGARDV